MATSNTDFWQEIDKLYNEGTIISKRCNQKIKEAQAKYPFLKQSTGEASHAVEEIRVTNNTKITLPKNKSFFNIFSSSSLNKVYDVGVQSFNFIKDTASNIITSVTNSFNFVSNKIFSYPVVNPDEQLIEEILSTPENELDEIFEDITYEKLADLINNASDELVNTLINHISYKNFEQVLGLISPDKFNMLVNKNSNGLTLDQLTEQELNKLSNKNILEETLKDIITLAGEENLVKHVKTTFTNIPSKNLEIILSNISTDGGSEILSFLENSSELLGSTEAAAAA